MLTLSTTGPAPRSGDPANSRAAGSSGHADAGRAHPVASGLQSGASAVQQPPRATAGVRFDPHLFDTAGAQGLRSTATAPSRLQGPFLPNQVTDGASGNSYLRNEQGGYTLCPSRRQEKARDPGPPGPDSSSHMHPPDTPHLRLPAIHPMVPVPPSGFSLPPIAPLMNHRYTQPPPSSTSAHRTLFQPCSQPQSGGHSLPRPCHLAQPPTQDPSQVYWDPHWQQGSYGQTNQQASVPQSRCREPSAEAGDDVSQASRPMRKKPTLADPRKAVVGSTLNPFRSRTGGCNPKYAHELRHNNWARWTPIGGFAPRFNTDGLSEALSSGDSLLLESGAGSVSLRAKGFSEIPIEDTNRADFTGIATNLPRAIREHLIPYGETDVGSDHALAIAEIARISMSVSSSTGNTRGG